jgi:BCD family chlorophyll transporter-like MFS transporter
LAQVWDEPAARRFTIFVFLSMLAYSSQDLILEPFAGAVFDMTPGQTTQLSGLQHGGVLLGMLCVALAGSGWARGRLGSVQAWMVGGCLASALAMDKAKSKAVLACGFNQASMLPSANTSAIKLLGIKQRWST